MKNPGDDKSGPGWKKWETKKDLAGVAHLFDDAGDGRGGLGAYSEPFVGLFEIEGVIFPFDHWVVGSKLLDVTTVAALAAVDGYDLVIGAVLGTFACKTESYHK